METTENSQQENLKPAELKSKKKFSKKIIISLIVFAVMLTSIIGIAHAKRIFHDGPEGFIIDKMTENLNLSESQKAQVEKIRAEIKAKMEARKNEMDKKNPMEDFANEFKKDNLDKSKLIELDNRRATDKQEMKDFMIDKLIEFHNILTPEQRNQVVDNMKSMHDKFHNMMDKKWDGKEKREKNEE